MGCHVTGFCVVFFYCILYVVTYAVKRNIRDNVRYLMVQIIFQNFKFQFLSTTMKFPKKFDKFSSWSKKFKRHRKLNDGSPGYWEKYFGVGNMFLRYFKLHLKIFLEAHFFTLQELVRFSKNHCRQILWNFELKRSPSMQNRKFYFIKCDYFFDPTNRWFLRRGGVFLGGHTVYSTSPPRVSFSPAGRVKSKLRVICKHEITCRDCRVNSN